MYGTVQFKLDLARVQQNATQHTLQLHTCVCVCAEKINDVYGALLYAQDTCTIICTSTPLYQVQTCLICAL